MGVSWGIIIAAFTPPPPPSLLPSLQSEMKKLEAMRLEVDSRRRTVGESQLTQSMNDQGTHE